MVSFSFLLLFGHGEDSLDPKDSSNNLWRILGSNDKIGRQGKQGGYLKSLSNRMQAYQHALRESHHSLVRNTSLKATYLDWKLGSKCKCVPRARGVHCLSQRLSVSPWFWGTLGEGATQLSLSSVICDHWRVLTQYYRYYRVWNLKMFTGQEYWFYSGEPRVKGREHSRVGTSALLVREEEKALKREGVFHACLAMPCMLSCKTCRFLENVWKIY